MKQSHSFHAFICMTSTLLKVYNDFDNESLNRMNLHNHNLVQKLKNNKEIKKEKDGYY